MAKYLGATVVEQADTLYKDYTEKDWAMTFIEMYGQIDGAHHKTWVLDQVARILLGTKVIIELAKWDDGTEEYRFSTWEQSDEYIEWRKEMLGDYDEENEEYEYTYDEGIAP